MKLTTRTSRWYHDNKGAMIADDDLRIDCWQLREQAVARDTQIIRLEVPGGWIVWFADHGEPSNRLFIPDPQHGWEWEQQCTHMTYANGRARHLGEKADTAAPQAAPTDQGIGATTDIDADHEATQPDL